MMDEYHEKDDPEVNYRDSNSCMFCTYLKYGTECELVEGVVFKRPKGYASILERFENDPKVHICDLYDGVSI